MRRESHHPERGPKGLPQRTRERSASGGETHWQEVAGWYDQLVGNEGSEYHREVILPGVLRMLRLKEEPPSVGKPLRVLDVACGQGVLCRMLAQEGQGAIQMTGVDAAPALLEAARGRQETDRLPITYYLADATRLPEQAELGAQRGTFDAVTCVLAIQNMTPLSPVWKGCGEMLRPGGRLIVVMMHPCFRVPQHSDWHWDERKRRQSRMVSTYLTSVKVEIQAHPGLAAHGKTAGESRSVTTHFHRPLQAYFNTLGGAGLPVEHVEEWASHKKSQAGPRAAELDRARKEIPMFLAIRARKA